MGTKKRLVLTQSSYLPWKGFFDLLNSADQFVFYDDVQYTKQDWRNRNKIKSAQGLVWLTIPIGEVPTNTAIKDVRINSHDWGKKHWRLIEASYSKTPYYREYKDRFAPLFLDSKEQYLCEVNYKFTKFLAEFFQINTPLSVSTDYKMGAGKTERIVELCKQCEADIYVCGPAGKSFLKVELFRQEGMEVEWMDYSGYPEYDQLYPPFEHKVSVLDLIFHTGPDARKYMKSFGAAGGR